MLQIAQGSFRQSPPRQATAAQFVDIVSIKRCDQAQFRTAERADVDVAAAGIQPFQPLHAGHQFGRVPFPLRLLTRLRMGDDDFVTVSDHRRHLPLDGFAGAISGRSMSATALAFRWFCIVCGGSQSQNALTSSAVVNPVVTANAY